MQWDLPLEICPVVRVDVRGQRLNRLICDLCAPGWRHDAGTLLRRHRLPLRSDHSKAVGDNLIGCSVLPEAVRSAASPR